MDPVFTRSAVERIRALSADPSDKAELALMMSAVTAADGPDDLKPLGVINLSKDGKSNVFVIGHGRWRALLTIETDHPDRMVIAKVFHVQESDSVKAEGIVRDAPEVAR